MAPLSRCSRKRFKEDRTSRLSVELARKFHFIRLFLTLPMTVSRDDFRMFIFKKPMAGRGGRAASVVVLVAALLSGFAQQAFAHGGLSMDKDVCKLQLGVYAMHFTGYQPEATGSKEFCEDIPEAGPTVVVLDAINPELREIPIEVRIIQDPGEKTDAQAVTVLHLAPKRYPTGSISLEHVFDQPGKFVGLVTAGENGEYVSRFPFSVAGNKSTYGKYLLMLVVPLLGFVLYRFSGRARRAAGHRPVSSSNEAL